MPGLRDGDRPVTLAAAPARLQLPLQVVDAVVRHARASLPHEACGLLAGSRLEGRVSAFHPARNEHASPLRYSVHPEDLVRIVLGIEAAGEDLVAIFHSHVGSPAVPSAADIRESRYPDVLHLLASLGEGDPSQAAIRAWRISDGGAEEIGLEIG